MRAQGDIRPAASSEDGVRVLVAAHLANSHSLSPPESAHALGLAGLDAADISLFVIDGPGGAHLLAMGALRDMGNACGEIKSMYVAAAARGKGLGARMLDHLLAQARARGFRSVWLETGSMDAYAPARGLYRRAGFVFCSPFDGYVEDPHSVFMTLDLTQPG